jgi:hypothetical protein
MIADFFRGTIPESLAHISKFNAGLSLSICIYAQSLGLVHIFQSCPGFWLNWIGLSESKSEFATRSKRTVAPHCPIGFFTIVSFLRDEIKKLNHISKRNAEFYSSTYVYIQHVIFIRIQKSSLGILALSYVPWSFSGRGNSIDIWREISRAEMILRKDERACQFA